MCRTDATLLGCLAPCNLDVKHRSDLITLITVACLHDGSWRGYTERGGQEKARGKSKRLSEREKREKQKTSEGNTTRERRNIKRNIKIKGEIEKATTDRRNGVEAIPSYAYSL
ncbi:hypothetical protein B0I35DRAFT_29106 [Stachybotrys elegans]|uniref:Uncharacterized protein n=1 Tax=Stachybotrys elegans TaxID=80388 RepID=A0A8K0WX47_9HYPO|nr:hypothetical protein B0I35DRAFT_29106 [Stachybotrys elegans]